MYMRFSILKNKHNGMQQPCIKISKLHKNRQCCDPYNVCMSDCALGNKKKFTMNAVTLLCRIQSHVKFANADVTKPKNLVFTSHSQISIILGSEKSIRRTGQFLPSGADPFSLNVRTTDLYAAP